MEATNLQFINTKKVWEAPTLTLIVKEVILGSVNPGADNGVAAT